LESQMSGGAGGRRRDIKKGVHRRVGKAVKRAAKSLRDKAGNFRMFTGGKFRSRK
jgi:hypothetical protein